ncbi:MAG: 16S rRNA (adenine(1518)-N(6)/adenine(1519)-N(6))-dimethyltransferase RsmA [Gemmatimonadota bacterium]|nr:16S rRNA (adenine(1518)-N(6)/adenine(1519)-N(6))-dimethyltransferase RsmA [Gemmatimonadota bacterium]
MSRPKRSLSQNFLVDPNLQRKIVSALDAGPGDAVLEIGPGHGELSRHLVGEVDPLVVVEKDDDLAELLRQRWASRSDVRVVHGDALEVDLLETLPADRPYRVLSNLPYAVTSPLLFRVLGLDPPARRIVVTVQKEVGVRLAAEPGTGAYGSLTVGVQARATVRLAFDVSRHAFRPVPDVESATVVIDPDPERIRSLPEPGLRRLTRAAFGRRRKQLQTILRSAPEYALDRPAADALCRRLGVDPRVRPERLSPEQFVRLAELLGGGAAEEGGA